MRGDDTLPSLAHAPLVEDTLVDTFRRDSAILDEAGSKEDAKQIYKRALTRPWTLDTLLVNHACVKNAGRSSE